MNKCVRVFYAAILLALAVSLVLQCIGLVTPGWLVLDFNVAGRELKFSMGLWYVNYCSEGTCGTDSLNAFWENYYTGPERLINHEMTEYQIETVLAAIFTLLTLACILKVLFCSQDGVYNKCNQNVWRVASAFSALAGLINHEMIEYQIETVLAAIFTLLTLACILKVLFCSHDGVYNKCNQNIWRMASAFSALAGILALVAAIRYGQHVQEAHEENSDPGPSPFKEPWSLIITGTGGILVAVVCVAVLFETIRVSSRIHATEPPNTQEYDFSHRPWTRDVYEYDHGAGRMVWKTRTN